MNLGFAWRAGGWLVRDTFRQARATGLSWALLAASAAGIGACLTATIDGTPDFARSARVDEGGAVEVLPTTDREAVKVTAGIDKGVQLANTRLTLLFGKLEVPLGRDGRDGVRWLHYILASHVAETLGVLLCLVWTAGFLPSFLKPQHATVLLMKPVPRGGLLAGKYLGAVLFVALHAAVFVGGTWCALGLRTGVWRAGYLMAWPLLLVQFAAFYGFSTLVAVTFRSTVAALLGTVGCWLVCTALNLGHHAVLAASIPAAAPSASPAPPANSRTPVVAVKHEAKAAAPAPTPEAAFSPALAAALKGAYWILPKPVDFGYLTYQALDAAELVGAPFYYHPLMDCGAVDLRWSVGTSLAFAAVLLWLAAKQFADTDY